MATWQLNIINDQISSGNISTTAIGTVLRDPTEVPILYGALQAIPGTDPTATVTLTVKFGTITITLPTVTMTGITNIPFAIPNTVDANTSLIASYSTVVTGIDGHYNLFMRV